MGDPEIIGKQRINLISWHAMSCPDGNSRHGRPWKKEIADHTGLSQALVTKMTKAAAHDGAAGFKRETLDRLCVLADEAFLGILGFKDKATSTATASSAPNQRWVMGFVHAASQDDYVDLCIEYDVTVTPEQRELARKRAEAKERQHIEANARWRTDEAAYWFQPYNTRSQPKSARVPMHDSEIEAINTLFQLLASSAKTSKTTIVDAFPHSGIAHALQVILPTCEGFQKHYHGGVHHLHIGALEYPDDARVRLGKQLLSRSEQEDDPYRQMPVEKKIAIQLHQLNQILIIHGASAIPERALGFIRKLSDELEDESGRQLRKGVSRLILTTWNPGSFNYLNNRSPISFTYRASVSPDEALKYFNVALEHYRVVRGIGNHKMGKAGPRAENSILKRAEHHYRGKGSAFTELPSAVRFRAFCASDTMNASPFDPTQGVWKRVDPEWRHSIPEISDCLSDIQSDLRNFLSMDARGDLPALRVISTSLFFLTKEMLANLKDHPTAKSATRIVEITHHLQSKYVNFDPGDGGEASGKYSAPLLVRSIVQDDWMRFDRTSRCTIHEAIGDILRDMVYSEDYDEVHQEIPYEYPWGDSEVVLALEAIRHFARAAESATEDRAIQIVRKALDTYDEFLELGTFSGSNIEASRQTAGRLSRAHGLHALKYEALCLLSADGRGVRAPVGTNAKEQHTFFRELGITLARMLRPQEAIAAFMKCLELDDLANFDRAYVLAHAVSTAILCGDLKRAGSFLDDARRLEFVESDGELRKKIINRNNARAAMFAFARGRRSESRTLWEEIAEEGITPFHGERSISYFDTFLASTITLRRDQYVADKLWASIERASHMALDQGFEHERLRIDIRKASFARILGFPTTAEAILDHVGLDLAKHSGAEILFREFQIESAETLRSLSRPRYAFVAYAWPAFQSLRRRSAEPYLRRSRNLCARLLSSMNEIHSEPPPSTRSNKFWLELGRNSDGNLYPLFSVDLLPASEDVERYFVELADPEKRRPYVTLLRE